MTNQDYGTVEHEGKTLKLTQQAFCGNYPGIDVYVAAAVDEEGNEYQVKWNCLEGWMDMDDESDCCDWSIYTVEAR